MIAALDSHSIGVLSGFPLHPRRSSDLSASEKQPRPLVPSLFSIPGVAVLLARTCFYNSSKGLAGYPRSAIPLLLSFIFLCHPSQPGSFHDPEEPTAPNVLRTI
jgi:hypothetical protein